MAQYHTVQFHDIGELVQKLKGIERQDRFLNPHNLHCIHFISISVFQMGQKRFKLPYLFSGMFLVLPLMQVAIKNNIDVFYFACLVPMNVFFTEDGQMDKRVFLATWKDIPAQNEVQYTLANIQCNAGIVLNMSQSSWLG